MVRRRPFFLPDFPQGQFALATNNVGPALECFTQLSPAKEVRVQFERGGEDFTFPGHTAALEDVPQRGIQHGRHFALRPLFSLGLRTSARYQAVQILRFGFVQLRPLLGADFFSRGLRKLVCPRLTH